MKNEAIIRRDEVERRTGLSRSTIYHLMDINEFPRPVRIGNAAVGWVESEITAYIADRIAERDQSAGTAK